MYAPPPELPPATAQEISDLQRQTLEEQRLVIVRDVDPSRYFAYMRSKGTLDADDEEEISAKPTRRKRCEEFLNVLSSRGSAGYVSFVEALIKGRVQVHIAQAMNQRYEALLDELRRRKGELLASGKSLLLLKVSVSGGESGAVRGRLQTLHFPRWDASIATFGG